MGVFAAGSWRCWFMRVLWICINFDMLLLFYHRGPFCLWPKPSRPPRLYSQALFTMRAVTGQRSFCRVLSPRQKMALWGTTGIHKYSSPEKFIEFVVKDLWSAAEVVIERGAYEPCFKPYLREGSGSWLLRGPTAGLEKWKWVLRFTDANITPHKCESN